MKNKKRHFSSRTIRWIYAVSFILVLFVSAGIALFFTYSVKITTEENTGKYDRYYALISGDRKLDFWQSVYDGAYETGKENGVFVELLGDNLNDTFTKEELMEIAISSGVDGIIVPGDESEEMTDLIERASMQNIPVVTVYSDAPSSTRCCYVGVGSYNLGREYGKQIVRIAEDRENNDTISSTIANKEINVVTLVNSYEDNSDQNIVWSGIQNAVETEQTGITKINLSMTHVDERNPFTVEESIHDLFRSDSIPDVIVCLNETNTESVYQAVVDSNKVGKVTILGYYDSETILKGIDRSVIYASMSVDTYQMGRYCVEALDEYNETGNTNQYMPADITLIDGTNVNEYMESKGENE